MKDFMAEHVCNKVMFYIGMVVEDEQTFEGLIRHLKNALSVWGDC